MAKIKVLTLYWNSEGDPNTTMKVYTELFGIEHLDFYQDAISLLTEIYEDPKKGIIEYQKLIKDKQKTNKNKKL